MNRIALLLAFLTSPAAAQYLTPAEQQQALPALCQAAVWANRMQFAEPCQVVLDRLKKEAAAEAAKAKTEAEEQK